MTRQQEGDEASVTKFCDECGFPIEPVRGIADAQWRHELPQGYTYTQLEKEHPGCFNNPKLPATVQPEDETTLPALGIDIKDYNRSNGHVEFRQEELEIREAQLLAALRDLKTALDRESETTARFDAKMEALEAERDALKAERDELLQQKHTDGVNLASLIIQRDDFKDAWHAASDLAKKQVYVAAELRMERNALKDEIRENGSGIDLRKGFQR